MIDLLTPEIDPFMPFPRGPFVTICSKIGLFVCKNRAHEIRNVRMDARKNGPAGNIMPPASLDWPET